MTDYFDHLTFEDRQFILWVKSPEFSYDYVLCLNDWQPPFEIYSKQEFFKLVEGIADEIVDNFDNYDSSDIVKTFAGNREEPPEYDIADDAIMMYSIFEKDSNNVITCSTTNGDMRCVGIKLTDNIYQKFLLLDDTLTNDEIYQYITELLSDRDKIIVDNEQQYMTIKTQLKQQQSQPFTQLGVSQDDISDLFETKTITFNQFYQIVCENTELDKLDEIRKIIEKFPNIIEQTKKYISHCIYELQRETVPLYYTVIKQLKIIPTLDIDTLAVDACGNLWFNPLFVQKRLIKNGDDSLLKGVLVHEAMHLIDRTQARIITAHRSAYDKALSFNAGDEDVKIYQLIHEIGNYAYDLIINRDVMKEGFKLPEFGIIAKKDENGHYIYEFDFTTENDTQPDIKRIDVSRFTGEKAYHMYVGAYKYVVDKLFKQGRLTQKQYEHCNNLINAIQQ